MTAAQPPPWDAAEEFWLRLGIGQGLTAQELTSVLRRRSRRSVIAKAWRLKLAWKHRHARRMRDPPRERHP